MVEKERGQSAHLVTHLWLSLSCADQAPDRVFAACYLKEDFIARICRSRISLRQRIFLRHLWPATRGSIMKLVYRKKLDRWGFDDEETPTGAEAAEGSRLTKTGCTTPPRRLQNIGGKNASDTNARHLRNLSFD